MDLDLYNDKAKTNRRKIETARPDNSEHSDSYSDKVQFFEEYKISKSTTSCKNILPSSLFIIVGDF